MALKTNASLQFTAYRAEDAGIVLIFLCADPGPGQQSHYEVLVTDAELAAVVSGLDFRNLVLTKLQRRFRASSKLDALIGQSVTV